MTKLRVGIRGVASSAAWFEIVAVTVSDRSAGKTHPEAINGRCTLGKVCSWKCR